MSNRKIKTAIYLPVKVKAALSILKDNDELGRSMSQLVLDIILRDKRIKEIMSP